MELSKSIVPNACLQSWVERSKTKFAVRTKPFDEYQTQYFFDKLFPINYLR